MIKCATRSLIAPGDLIETNFVLASFHDANNIKILPFDPFIMFPKCKLKDDEPPIRYSISMYHSDLEVPSGISLFQKEKSIIIKDDGSLESGLEYRLSL